MYEIQHIFYILFYYLNIYIIKWYKYGKLTFFIHAYITILLTVTFF